MKKTIFVFKNIWVYGIGFQYNDAIDSIKYTDNIESLKKELELKAEQIRSEIEQPTKENIKLTLRIYCFGDEEYVYKEKSQKDKEIESLEKWVW